MNDQINTQNSPKVLRTGWRIFWTIFLFLTFGVCYFLFFGIWSGMAYWGGPYVRDLSRPDQYYLEYVWPIILIILLIIPTILTATKIRWVWWALAWFLSTILSVVSWSIWFMLYGK